ncbi:Phosphoinositide-3-kinase-interacting protein 1 [Fukomys damarensis]|uniref:Phosphoinositide-3-kinase-interacting protein 1 n=2 Tax=Fukomys damarensis TaxID=885580 RepID=A0A091CVK1_FUKDA|nr:Phosphoinositide-3-kinase-interacting protein 1 [Fukomys damarensis]
MLLVWIQTFLLSNMLLAEAYGSGGDHNYCRNPDRDPRGPWCYVSGEAGTPEKVPCRDARCPSPRELGDHNYCRNPDRDPRGPWCYVSGEAGTPEKVPCRDARCPETTSQAPPAFTTQPKETSEVPGDDEVQVFAPASTLPARSEAVAVQPVIGISQRVQMNSKEKKDLGTLGYVLGITMMVIIIAIGAGIILGYTYKRGKDLKEKHEQKVCEREMQRITLPLSAFTNPTCEIVDERTVVVHSNQTPVDLQEGSTPLMGQAGTPGA